MKFKEIKPGMVIHCPTEEDARALLRHLEELGYLWVDKTKPTDTTLVRILGNKLLICIEGSGKISYGTTTTMVNDEDCKITEFSDLIEPEPKFKVGDKVKIRKGLKSNVVYGLHCYDEYMDSFKNDTLTILEVCDNFDAKTERIVAYLATCLMPEFINKMPAADVEPVRKWIPCSEMLPDNAKDPDAFRPKYQIYTSFGITEGWYGWLEKESGWYALIWFMDGRYEEWNVDFKRGDVPKVIFIPDGGEVKVYAWRDFPEPPKMDGDAI